MNTQGTSILDYNLADKILLDSKDIGVLTENGILTIRDVILSKRL